MAELTKDDVMQIKAVLSQKPGQEDLQHWTNDKVILLKVVALAAFDVREAAEALLSSTPKEFRNDEMVALSDAVKKAQAVGRPPAKFMRG